MRRGACPSLSVPMQTGDGLLARLNPANGALSPRQLAGVALAAADCGNGILEITARGSLQIRGLTATSAHRLEEAVRGLGIAAGPAPEIRVGPLAGRDAAETADPRRLADAIRNRIDRRGLAPKISVTVDGGGALPLDAIGADVRLEAVPGDEWAVQVGGLSSTARMLGTGAADTAAAAALDVLGMLAQHGPTARGRDLDDDALARLRERLKPCVRRPRPPVRLPVGRFALRDGLFARGVALAFGQCAASELAALAEAADKGVEFRLAPGRGLLALGLSDTQDASLVAAAGGLGMVTDADDPRLRIVACVGAPACASAYLPTREMARALAVRGAGLPPLHLSGCAKQCAKPAGPCVSLIGGAGGFEIVAGGMRVPGAVRDALAHAAAVHGAQERRQHA